MRKQSADRCDSSGSRYGASSPHGQALAQASNLTFSPVQSQGAQGRASTGNVTFAGRDPKQQTTPVPAGFPSASSQPASNLRKRRFPYTSVACDECQRRKIKCTGERPCKGCRDVHAVCLFDRSTRFRTKDRESVSSSDTLQGRPREASEPGSSAVMPKPGSSDYYLSLAGCFLASPDSRNAKPVHAEGLRRGVDVQGLRRLIHYRSIGASVDILNLLDERQWTDIIRTYDEEIGLLYPFLDLEALRRQVQAAHQSAARAAPPSAHLGPDTGKQQKQQRARDIFLLLAAIVFVLADPGAIDIANSSVEEMHAAALVKTQLGDVEMDDLSVLILSSMYFFLCDREVLAWRGNGTVLRLLQEMGYHTSGNLSSNVQHEDREAKEKLFWTVYTLDRRWSYGTGLPFAIQDSDIDHDPAFAENSLSSAYLKHMVAYCRIASEVRKSALEAPASDLATPDAVRDLLDFRVLQWRRDLPARLHFRGIEDRFKAEEESRGQYRIRLTLYLRANQMRTIIHRKWAARPGSFKRKPSNAHTLAALAQDTIRTLVALDRDTDIYHAQHRTFNHFLETALSSLLLAICRTGDVDTASCLQDAQAAMDLVRRLSSESPITRRLLDKLQHVQDTLLELGARRTETLSSSYSNRPTTRSQRTLDGQASGQTSTTSRALAQPDSMNTADALPPDVAPGQVTGRAFPSETAAGRYGHVQAPSPTYNTFPSMQPLDFADAHSFLPLARYPDLVGEMLDEYGNNFSF